ncbi:metabotropic glutamate receptor-like [Asterias rubens]|uniref:metabotropic glutamate receptor-like n=1 Tax=Asterias rubens TaxID=7604 RepID=UPI0014554BEB|nr:metabotropic glutamate receptor-like [Asterias rubens]
MLVLLFVLRNLASLSAGEIPATAMSSFSRSGDVILGGLYPIHSWVSGLPCSGMLSRSSLERTALQMYAIEQINARQDLLPNVTIGFDIRDSCFSETVAMWSALALASTAELPQDDVEFKRITSPQRGKLLCIIGGTSSFTTIPASLAASLYRIPMISGYATSNELSVKSRFPYFARTVPADSLQATAIVDILLHFGWKYIGMYFQLNSYGIHGAQAVLDLVTKHDICVAFSVPVRPEAPESEMEEAVLNLETFPSARVVVLITYTTVAGRILDLNAKREGSPNNIVFVGSDGTGSWARNNLNSLLRGSVFVNLNYQEIPGFPEYYSNTQLQEDPFNPWFQEYKDEWMQSKGCSNISNCTIPIDNNDSTMVDAIYAFAYALHDLLQDRCNNSISCRELTPFISGHELIPYIHNLSFQGLNNHITFDSNGNPGGNYQVFGHRGEHGLVQIGSWVSSTEAPLRINSSAVELAWGSQSPPVSLCREVCQPGYVEVPLPQKCCYGCRQCPSNARVMGSECEPCPKDRWPDVSFKECLIIVPTPPNWNDPVVIFILIMSCFGLILSGLAASGLIYHRNNSLIKAASRELSSINILGLTLAFLAPFPLLVPPTDVSCITSEMIVSLCITLTYAPTLLKVNRIFRIFEAAKKSKKCPRFIGSRSQVVIVLIALVVVVFMSIIGTLIHPSRPAKLFFSPPTNYVEAYCAFGYGFLVSSTYNLVLILACCYYAFKARRVPSNFNESKFIAISVYSTLVFGMAAVPVYITAMYTLQKVATFCIAILLNSFLTLCCVYMPKLHAIILEKDVELCEWRVNTITMAEPSTVASKPSPDMRRVINVRPASVVI